MRSCAPDRIDVAVFDRHIEDYDPWPMLVRNQSATCAINPVGNAASIRDR